MIAPNAKSDKNLGGANEAIGANFCPLGANLGANFHHWGQIWGQIWGQKGQMELRQPLGELGSSQNMPGIRGKKKWGKVRQIGGNSSQLPRQIKIAGNLSNWGQMGQMNRN